MAGSDQLTKFHIQRGRSPSGSLPVAGQVAGDVESPILKAGAEADGLERNLEFHSPADAVGARARDPDAIPLQRRLLVLGHPPIYQGACRVHGEVVSVAVVMVS